MINRKKLFLLLITLLMMAVFLAACGGGDGDAGDAGNTTTVAAAGDGSTTTTTTTTQPPDVWDAYERVNFLLLGSDAGVGRTGTRTDTILLLSIAPETGDAAMFSVPRNLTEAPLPDGMVRLYSQYANQDLAYLGGTTTKYVPIGDRVEVNVGADPDITIARRLKDQQIKNVVARQYRRRLDDTFVMYFDLLDYDETFVFEESVVVDRPFDEVVETVTAALAEQGFLLPEDAERLIAAATSSKASSAPSAGSSAGSSALATSTAAGSAPSADPAARVWSSTTSASAVGVSGTASAASVGSISGAPTADLYGPLPWAAAKPESSPTTEKAASASRRASVPSARKPRSLSWFDWPSPSESFVSSVTTQ